MAGTKPLDIVARFRTVTTEFNTRQVERELDDADRAFRDSGRAADRWSRDVRDAGDDAATGLRRGKGRFGAVGAEVGEEFSQNFGEAVRSGNPLGAVFETATSLGPALGLAGLAAAAGAGIVSAVVSGIKANEQRIKDAGASLYDAMQDGMLDQAEKDDLLTQVLGVDNVPEAMRKVSRISRELGVKASDVFAEIISGGSAQTAIDDYMKQIEAGIERAAQAGQAPDPELLRKWKEYQDLLQTSADIIDYSNEALRTQRTILGTLRPPTYGSPTGAGRDTDYARGGRG
jgi:hypothetical protein